MEIIDKSFVDKLSKEVIKKIQVVDNKHRVFKFLEDKKDLEFHPTYNVTVEMSERIKVHAELQTFPKNLFKARAPRMTDDEEKYLRENYKQVTMPVYIDFKSTIDRIFHDANYTLSFEKEDKKGDELTFQEYVETGLPEIGSLEVYVKSIITHAKFTDANGVIGIRPRKIVFAHSQTGETVVDDSVLNEPIPIYYTSAQVLKDEPGEYMLLLSNEKSMVVDLDKKVEKGYVLEFYDKQNIYRIEQYGKFSDFKFRTILFYEHGLGKVPCMKLKGVPSLQKGKLVWVSPFMYAVDLLDLVAMNSSYLQVIINNCVFPYRVMYGDDCEYEYTNQLDGSKNMCDMGYVFDTQLDAKIICPGCGGTGLRSRINPFGVMLIRTGNATGASDKEIGQTPMAYVEPTIETPRFLMGKIDSDEMKARRILHLNTSSTQVQGGVEQMNPAANTATGMITDLKALYAFVKPISDQIFELWEFMLWAIGTMRNGSTFKKPTLSYPNTFDFYTESDYMNNIAMAVKSGMPPFVVQTILFKYLQSIFYNEKKTTNVFNLIYSTDRLITMSNMDINAKMQRGLIEKWEATLHDSALTFVDQILKENPTFFETTEFPAQQEALRTKAKETATAATTASDKEKQKENENMVGGMLKKIPFDTAA